MKAPVDLDELLDSPKENDDGIAENETGTSLVEEKRETTGTDKFDQWNSSPDEEESINKSEPVPVTCNVVNEMQSNETSSRGTVRLRDADVQTYGEYDVTYLSRKAPRGVEYRPERTKRGKGRDALSLKRKFWLEEVSRDPKNDTNARSGSKFSETKVQRRQLKSHRKSVPFPSKLETEARERYSSKLKSNHRRLFTELARSSTDQKRSKTHYSTGSSNGSVC